MTTGHLNKAEKYKFKANLKAKRKARGCKIGAKVPLIGDFGASGRSWAALSKDGKLVLEVRSAAANGTILAAAGSDNFARIIVMPSLGVMGDGVSHSKKAPEEASDTPFIHLHRGLRMGKRLA